MIRRKLIERERLGEVVADVRKDGVELVFPNGTYVVRFVTIVTAEGANDFPATIIHWINGMDPCADRHVRYLGVSAIDDWFASLADRIVARHAEVCKGLWEQVGAPLADGEIGIRQVAHFAVEAVDGDDPAFSIFDVESNVWQRLENRRHVFDVRPTSREEVTPQSALLLCHARIIPCNRLVWHNLTFSQTRKHKHTGCHF